MRRFLSIIAATLLIAVSCEKEAVGNINDSILTCTSSTELSFSAEGGQGEVTFSIENPAKGYKVEATSSAEWVSNIVANDTVTFTVEPNESSEHRTAVLLVSYGIHNFAVMINQGTPMVFNGSYNGRDTVEGTMFNYTVFFSDNGVESADNISNSTYYYCLNIYSTKIHGFNENRLPEGVYTFDKRSKGQSNSFSFEGSKYVIVGNEDTPGEEFKFMDGVLTVTADGITADLTTAEGEAHKFAYKGSLELKYKNQSEPSPMSLLTEDYTFNVENGYIRCYYYGDFYGIGYDLWSISMIEDHASFSGDYLKFDVLVDTTKGYVPDAFLGTYNAYKPEMGEQYTNIFLPGRWFAYATYSWYVTCEQSFITNTVCPISDGVITFEKVDGVYCVRFDCKDDKGHRFAGTFSNHSIGEVWDVRDASNPTQGY